MAATEVTFFLNGEKKQVARPDPTWMLIDYLRQPGIGLSGPKKPCGQGGCGGCTVVLSHWDDGAAKPVHRAINACLRPVAALDGLSVTTVEGTGSVETTMNKVAHRLAAHNGTQCGYCTNGWVMAMTGFLANDPPPEARTKKRIEALFDGNLCRCTGYRAILEGMKSFASDWTAQDAANCMQMKIDKTFDAHAVAGDVTIPFGADQRITPARPDYDADGRDWIAVETVDAAQAAHDRALKAGRRPRFVQANTSWGIYRQEIEAADTFIDIAGIDALRAPITHQGGALQFGAGITYDTLLAALDTARLNDGSAAGAMKYMASRTAGTLVRNAATVGGNTMLVADHVLRGEPFPSDLVTAMCGIGAGVIFRNLRSGQDSGPTDLLDLLTAQANPALPPPPMLLLRYSVPTDPKGTVFAQKTALREVNSHSIVNWCSVIDAVPGSGGAPARIDTARIVLNGIGPLPLRATATEAALTGQPADAATLDAALAALAEEITFQQGVWAHRMGQVPDEGFTDAYRCTLAQGFLRKAFLNALVARGIPVPAAQASSASTQWGTWPVSGGRQYTQDYTYEHPVSEPYIKLMAMYQAQGEVRYTHETRPAADALFAAPVTAPVATGRFGLRALDGSGRPCFDALRKAVRDRFPLFRALLSSDSVPGHNLLGMAGDQPLMLPLGDRVTYQGQCLGLVLAETERAAQQIAAAIRRDYVQIDSPDTPILDIETALAGRQIFPDCPQSAPFVAHIWKVTRDGSDMSWVAPASPGDVPEELGTVQVDGAACAHVPARQACGGQLHFYMETQAAVAMPRDGDTLLVRASTQSPKGVQGAVASALGYSHNQVGIEVPQLGGAYGGKTEQSKFPAALAAVGAHVTGKPVHLNMDREDDSAQFGKRHPYLGALQLAVDDGTGTPGDKGLIRGLSADMYGDGGAFYDCSFVVSDCIQLRIDSAYYVPNYETTIDVCRTNTAPNTAYRAFGDIQATLMLENAIEEAAVRLGMDAAELREKNLYQLDQTTPAGQKLEHCYQREVWQECRTQSDYDTRKAHAEAFNAANRWRKRGVCLMPLKYGSGFNLTLLEQTTALVSIYAADGTILVRQGGADMGQGMVTKLAQITAYALGVPIEIVRVDTADTRVIANPSSTGASTGTQYNGLAIKNACDMLVARLSAFCEGNPKWCAAHGIKDPAKAHESWGQIDPTSGTPEIWRALVSAAFGARINLQAQAKAVIPGGERKLSKALTFKPLGAQPTGTGIEIDQKGAFEETVQEYVGFTYNAACVEVEVDTLTGEMKILHATIVYDMGKSMNPAIDVGQIEGAFVQGLGYLLTENIVYQPETGALNTVNTWRYKPPAMTTIPLDFQVRLFPRALAAKVPPDPNLLFSSKEVGEPPMVLANAAFFAIKSAVRAARTEAGLSASFEMSAPATVQTVAMACRS